MLSSICDSMIFKQVTKSREALVSSPGKGVRMPSSQTSFKDEIK